MSKATKIIIGVAIAAAVIALAGIASFDRFAPAGKQGVSSAEQAFVPFDPSSLRTFSGTVASFDGTKLSIVDASGTPAICRFGANSLFRTVSQAGALSPAVGDVLVIVSDQSGIVSIADHRNVSSSSPFSILPKSTESGVSIGKVSAVSGNKVTVIDASSTPRSIDMSSVRSFSFENDGGPAAIASGARADMSCAPGADGALEALSVTIYR